MKALKNTFLVIACIIMLAVSATISVYYTQYLINENKRLNTKVNDLKKDIEDLSTLLEHSIYIATESIESYETLMKTSVPGYNDLNKRFGEHEVTNGEATNWDQKNEKSISSSIYSIGE